MTFQRKKVESVNAHPSFSEIDGAIAAAFIAGGIGCLVIGLMTTGAEISAGLKNILEWSKAVGPLSGKTGVGIIAWIASWAILHFLWKDKETELKKTIVISLVLIGLGFLLTFPPVFLAFH
jgi:hypothetical protein